MVKIKKAKKEESGGGAIFITKELGEVKFNDASDASSLVNKVTPLTQEFGNGDLNTLRDKINEIIKLL